MEGRHGGWVNIFNREASWRVDHHLATVNSFLNRINARFSRDLNSLDMRVSYQHGSRDVHSVRRQAQPARGAQQMLSFLEH